MIGRLPRGAVLGRLADLVITMRRPDVLRVAVDGPDASGKTTLADELAARIDDRRPVVRIGIDGFHLPRERRHRRDLAGDGYYLDSFDYEALRKHVLEPFAPGADRRYRSAVFDYRTDSPLPAPTRQAPPESVLLFDGVFLLRPELRDWWDLRIFVHASPDEVLRRASKRDADLMGGTTEVLRRYEQRYLPGQRLYRETARPEQHADVVIDNDDPARPAVLKWPTVG